MAIADDWDFNYAAKILSHIDGVLSYDIGTGRQAAVGEYVRGNTSGAIGKIIAVTGATASGTLTLTNVVGLFQDNETFEVMSFVNFDGVVDKTPDVQGIHIGDVVTDAVTGTITVRTIEYNEDGLGGGTLFGDVFTLFTNNSSLSITGGEAGVALANGVGVDNDTALGTTQTAGTLAVPGTANTNDCVIIHYDAGTVAIPEQAIVQETTAGGARGLVERVLGVTATGSLIIVDSDSSGGGGDWTDDISLEIDQVIGYNNLVAGKVFSPGDVIVGVTSAATGRVLADTGTQLILADESGTWVTTEDINVDGVKIADANGTNAVIAAALLNLPDGIRKEQFADAVGGNASQGGIYAAANSLNIVRKSNSVYTLSQDTFDELIQLDDDEALDATGKGSAYQVVFDWITPDLSYRFMRQGGWTDTSGAEVWANPQTTGVLNKVTDTGFLYVAAQPFHMPQLYIEQNQEKVATSWLEGQIDVLVKVKTRRDTRFIAPATAGLGQLLPGGDPSVNGAYTVFAHEFWTSTYDHTQFNAAVGGVNTVALGTADDTAADRNPNGAFIIDWDAGSAATLLKGEMFTALAGNLLKVGYVVAQTGDAGATGTLEYVLKGGTQLADGDVCTGEVSGKAFTVNEPVSIGEVVAGFSADIAMQVVDISADSSPQAVITGTFNPGEALSQAVTGATGRLVFADTVTDIIYIQVLTGTFSGDNTITGVSSGATWNPGVTTQTYASVVLFSADLNNGEGAQPYSASVSHNLTGGGSPQTVQNGYQYSKYLTRAEEATFLFEGPGTADAGTIGRFFRKLKDSYGEVKPGNPMGPFTGNWALAQGWFLDTGFVAAADIRAFTVIDDNGVTRSPPNLQSMTISGIANLWRVAAFRSTGSGSTLILRNEFDVGVIGGGNNQAADSTILVGANSRTISPLPADVPDVGVLYVLDPNDTGNFLQFPYSSVNRTTNIFTLTSGTIGAVTGAVDLTLDDNVHVTFIREQAAGVSVTNTIQFVANIDVVYKARLKGFKPFRSTGEFTASGVILGVVQTADAQVDLP